MTQKIAAAHGSSRISVIIRNRIYRPIPKEKQELKLVDSKWKHVIKKPDNEEIIRTLHDGIAAGHMI